MFTLTNKFQITFAQGVKSVRRRDCELQGGKLLRLLSQLRPRIRPLEGATILKVVQQATFAPPVRNFARHATSLSHSQLTARLFIQQTAQQESQYMTAQLHTDCRRSVQYVLQTASFSFSIIIFIKRWMAK
jgi:hypothetical protein